MDQAPVRYVKCLSPIGSHKSTNKALSVDSSNSDPHDSRQKSPKRNTTRNERQEVKFLHNVRRLSLRAISYSFPT